LDEEREDDKGLPAQVIEEAMRLNLLLAIFWLAVGCGLLLLPHLVPEAGDWTVLGTGLSSGWLAILLALYNIARWWAVRASALQCSALEDTPRRRRRDADQRGVQEPDPNFSFTDWPCEPNTDREGG
jgi:hypothetical protein